METDWLQPLYEYRYEEDIPYSDDFGFWPEWLFKYYSDIPLGKAIESAYLTWESLQHIITPKYYILSSLATLLKNYFLTMEEEDSKLKLTCQHYNDFVKWYGKSVELIYITFIHAGIYTLGIYPEELVPDLFSFSGPPERKFNACIKNFWNKVILIAINKRCQIFETTALMFCIQKFH